MWTMYSFLLFLFCIALLKAHPRTAHEKLSSNLHITTVNEPGRADTKNQTHNSDAGLESMQADTIHHSQENGVMQNVQRPRFLVTYGNVYKPNQSFLSPVDPFQNILLYFLMNFGREMSQSSMEENKLRQPTEFFNNPRNKIDDPNKTLNREMLNDEQNEEVHFFPHVGGTCMCFNRRQELKAKAKGNAPQEEVNEQSYCQRFNTETTELKTENHNVPSSNDTKKSTIAVHGVREGSNKNNTIIKVLRLVGNNQTSNLGVTTKLTTAKSDDANKEEIVITGEEIVVDLQLTPDEGRVNKHKKPKEQKSLNKTAISGNDTHQLNITNTNKTRHDESYYFLSSSGGTDQRTTASNKLAFYMPGTNTIHVEDKQKYLRESKKRKKRVRRHLEKIEKYLHDNLKRHPVKKLRRNEEDVKDPEGKWQEILHSMKKGNNHTDHSNKLVDQKAVVESDDKKIMIMLPMAKMEDELDKMSDINGITNLKSVEEIIKYHNWAPIEQERKSQGPSRLSTIMPALLGVGTFLLIIGYIMKTKGWFYYFLSNKSHAEPITASKELQT